MEFLIKKNNDLSLKIKELYTIEMCFESTQSVLI